MSKPFSLSSTSISQNGTIPLKHIGNQFGSPGENIFPALEWSGAPAETKSFAITIYDHDAQTGSGLWHWVAYNIPATATALPESSTSANLPTGTMEGNTDMGKPGWFGPEPIDGLEHRYTFTVYALKTGKLELPPGATPAFAGFFIIQNAIAKATMTAKACLQG